MVEEHVLEYRLIIDEDNQTGAIHYHQTGAIHYR